MSTIALVTYGKLKEPRHADCMAALQQSGLLVIETRGSAHIDIARSHLACAALGLEADVVVFIDHDILFESSDVERLANVARETRGVVAVPYSTRMMGGSVVGGIAPYVESVIFYEGGGLYPATDVLGMGFTAIHRDVFELMDLLPEYALVDSMEGPMRPYFQKRIVDGYWMGEDASFCHFARVAGGTTTVDTRIRVKHLGDYAFGIEDCRRRLTEESSICLKIKGSEA